MQSAVSRFHSRTGRWMVLLLVLVGIYIYIQLQPISSSAPPNTLRSEDTSDLKELESLLKKTFDARINKIGVQDEVKLKQAKSTVTNAPQHQERMDHQGLLASVVTTTPYRKGSFSGNTRGPTTIPHRQFFGQTLRTTRRPAIIDPSGYVKSSTTTHDTNAVSSSGLSVNDVPKVHIKEVNCARVVEGDPVEIYKAEQWQEAHPKVPIPERAYLNMARDCPKFKKDRQYILKPASDEEAGFPLAFSIMMYKDIEQAERLLRAIYRPQNYYCLHVDKKSPLDFHRTIEAIASCFDNVFVAPHAIDVQWGWFSVVEPDLQCMEELYKRYTTWRYFINLTGQEFPLKTNLDLVRILRTFNGANNMEGTEQRRNTERTEFVHDGFFPTERKKEPAPSGIRLTKGSVHITVSRAFVDFILHNSLALKFKDWVKNTGVPDETYFSSLNHSPDIGVPGAYKGTPETNPGSYPFMTRFKNWGVWPFDYPCHGQRVRMICIFGVGDVAILAHRPELFTNKFYLDYQPLALDCMEELHFNRTREEIEGTLSFSTNYYKNLDFVRNHV